MSNNKFGVASLFSGAGGMDLGFVMANGFQLLLANDILSPPAQTYSRNFHHVITDISESFSLNRSHSIYLLGDITEVDFNRLRKEEVDVVIGGPPCQDFSVVRGPAKERQGIEVRRGRLYAHFVRALTCLQPKVFVFENVPGLKSANGGKAYETILEDFSKLNLRWGEIRKIVGNNLTDSIKNYSVVFSEVVDCASIGVPQKRKRLIMIGVREDLADWITANKLRQEIRNILLDGASLFRKYPLTPFEVFEGTALPDLNDEYRSIMEDYRDVAGRVETKEALLWKTRVWKKLSFDAVKDYLMINNITPKDDEEVKRAFEVHVAVLKKMGYYKNRLEGKHFADGSNNVPNELKEVLERLKMIPPGENHLFVRGTRWEVEGRGISLIYRRLHPLKPSPTIVAYGGGGTWGYHYKRSRGKLTNRERARLQTFPDWFLFSGSASEVRAQIGEAVPPLLGEKIAEAVKTILSSKKG